MESFVSEQCGDDIAARLRDLNNRVISELGCETYKRQ